VAIVKVAADEPGGASDLQKVPASRRPYRPCSGRTAVTRKLNLPGSATEDQFHLSVAELLDICLTSPNVFYTTFPAGYGKLSKGMAGRLRAKGMKAGMPDILVFHRRDHRSTFVIGIELKVGSNSPTSKQRTTHALLQRVGIQTYVVRTLHGVLLALRDAQIPYRNITIPEEPGAVETTQQEMFTP
jgi:hypothetical protein